MHGEGRPRNNSKDRAIALRMSLPLLACTAICVSSCRSFYTYEGTGHRVSEISYTAVPSSVAKFLNTNPATSQVVKAKPSVGPAESVSPPPQVRQSASVLPEVADYKVLIYKYDSKLQRGELKVDMAGHSLEDVRAWILKNIGEIASTKEVLLKAGQEDVAGGRYRVLDESITKGILTVEFSAGFGE